MNNRVAWVLPLILIIITTLLYSGFLHNPLIFDDYVLFSESGRLSNNLSFSATPRWLSQFSLNLTFALVGIDIVWFRAESLILHVSVALTLYIFLYQLWKTLLAPQETNQLSYQWLAFFAALIFALHPVAVYGAAYLIQRSIVMATLFTLLMWVSVLRGLEHRSRAWLWISVTFYALALLSKETVIMAPAVSIALAILWRRTQRVNSKSPLDIRHLIPIFVAYALIGIYVILIKKGILGTVYEIQGVDMALQLPFMDSHAQLIYPLSVFNQGALFFKYIGLWLLPNPLWMSIDIRVPFVTTFWIWPQTLGFVAFILYPIFSSILLWRGGRLGMLGFALLAPWLLFATEISTVRIQEPFVLYRSYLWAVPAFASFPLIFGRMQKRSAGIVLLLIAILMYPLAYDRLRTFSHPFILWDDAARLMEGKSGLPGLERIYLKYGNQLRKADLSEMAVTELTKAIQIRKNFIYAYNERGQAYLDLKRYKEALSDFNQTIVIIYNNGKPYPGQQLAIKILAEAYMGRGSSLEFFKQKEAALQSFQSACQLGLKIACTKITKPAG